MGTTNSTRRMQLQAGGALGAAKEQAFRVNPGLQVRSAAASATPVRGSWKLGEAPHHCQAWHICNRCCIP